MTNLKETLNQLQALSNEKMFKQNINHGAGENQYGVRLGEIRKLAKKIKSNHELALELWETNNIDAQRLAILIMTPKLLSEEDIEKMLTPISFMELADWFISYVIKKHAKKEELRQKWMGLTDKLVQRAAWSLTAERVVKKPEGLELGNLLQRIEKEMADAEPEVQWTMNMTLAEIGIHFSEHRERALNIGETLGVYKELVAPKGCTSPYAPSWINEMVSRQK